MIASLQVADYTVCGFFDLTVRFNTKVSKIL